MSLELHDKFQGPSIRIVTPFTSYQKIGYGNPEMGKIIMNEHLHVGHTKSV